MDTKKDSMIPECGNLADLQHFPVVVGAKQLRKALEKGRAKWVFLTENADPAIVEPLEDLCKKCGVSYTWVRSMADLGSACGIEVGAAAAAVVDRT